MKIIERYVFQSFLIAFALAWLVLSFVLTIGLLVQIAQYIMQGIPMETILLFMRIVFPETLTFTIPLSLLVSVLLVFSRLSADSEIAAMRACGVNLLAIMRYPILFAACCTLLGFYVNNEIVPRAHELKNNIKALISVDTGLKLLEPGRNIDEFEGVSLFFERKEGNWIYGLRATEYLQDVTREIRADKALISAEGTNIVLNMYNVQVEPIDAKRPGIATFGRITHTIPDTRRQREAFRKEKDFRFSELRKTMRDLHANTDGLPEDYRKSRLSICRTLFQKRFSEAFACICFVLIGVPLGIKANRKDSTIGMGISLAVALVYYLILILANVLQKSPAFYPHVLIWLPVAICLALAAVLIPKNL